MMFSFLKPNKKLHTILVDSKFLLNSSCVFNDRPMSFLEYIVYLNQPHIDQFN